MDFKIFKLTGRVLLDYRKYVRGNENASKPLVRRKLTRNVLMALKLAENIDGKGSDLYGYGNLHIYVKGDYITKIRNKTHKINWFYKNMNQYRELNRLLEIDKYKQISVGS